MMPTLEIYKDLQGNLFVWRDVYAWVDPFAEAEEWALRYAEIRQDSRAEFEEERTHFARIEAHLNGVIEAQQRVAAAMAQFNGAPFVMPLTQNDLAGTTADAIPSTRWPYNIPQSKWGERENAAVRANQAFSNYLNSTKDT